MSRANLNQQKQRRTNRTRSRLSGSANRPRLTVHISNLHVSAQLIDDTVGRTVAAASSVGAKSNSKNLTDKAVTVGEQIAKKAASAKVKQVVFDRGAKQYHGRIKALAESARKQGLKF